MKANLVFSLVTNLILLFHCSYSQSQNFKSSSTKAFQGAINYIESFNTENDDQLEKFFITYYEYPDLERRLKIEHSLQKSWGKLKSTRVVYDSENEIILLMQATKMSNEYLIFDLKLRGTIPEKMEYFTRTGINRPKGRNSLLTDMEVMYFADRAVPVKDTIIQETVIGIAKTYDSNYFMPEIGKRISTMLIDNLNNGKYNQTTKAGRLADSIKSDILDLHFDLHSWVEANRRLIPFDSIEGSSQNFGFEKVRVMDGNVGYIKLNEFSPLKEAQVIAGTALDSLLNCKALIFDLRDNHGGYPQMIQFIASYFFQLPTKINVLYDRDRNIVDEIWTLESVSGKRFDNSLPVIIITSSRTASAAEAFVNFFKKEKRAIIIGEITKGAGHPAKEVVINPLFVASIPYLRGDEKDVIEGEGIIPDILVPADKALEKAIKHINKILNN